MFTSINNTLSSNVDRLDKVMRVQAKTPRPIISLPEIDIALWLDDHNIKYRPQYPISTYFADFALPDHKVVIEYDGKAWHTDTQSDILREIKIINEGWKVYRISKRITKIYSSQRKEYYLECGGKVVCTKDSLNEVLNKITEGN